MSDIVERLLEQVDYLPREVRQEAAEEIKRLTMLLENSKHWEAEHLAEIERLRAALKLARCYMPVGAEIYDSDIQSAVDFVESALEPKIQK